MNAPNAERPNLTPIADLLGASVMLCLRHAQPLALTATAGALVGIGFGELATPQTVVGVVVWSIFINALVAGLQAPVWLFASFAQDGPIVEEESILAYTAGIHVALRRLGLPFFLLALAVGSWIAGPALASQIIPGIELLWLPPLVYVIIRFSLAGAAIARGMPNPFSALSFSWMLVRGRWWRTLGAQLPVLMLSGVLVVGASELESATGSRLVGALATSGALGLSAPLIAAVSIALLLDYMDASLPPPSPPAPQPPTQEPPTTGDNAGDGEAS